MQIVNLVTKNAEKIFIARRACEARGFQLKVVSNLDIPEFQNDELEEIARSSAQYAADKLGAPAVKIDSGLFIDALNGVPGPYSAFFEKRLDAQYILRMMLGEHARTARYTDFLAYATPGGYHRGWKNSTEGRIGHEIEGQHGMNFDRIFIREGDLKPLALFPDEERLLKYRRSHWEGLLDFLEHQKDPGTNL